MCVCDGGVTGSAFFDHVRRGGRPVVNSPKGQTSPLPPDFVARPVVDALCEGVRVGELAVHGPEAWLLVGDPYRTERPAAH